RLLRSPHRRGGSGLARPPVSPGRTMSDGVVIVGAGECGVRAAFALRQAGFEGAVTLLGEEPHLPYERPPLSKSAPPTVRPIATAEAYGAAGIDLVRGCRVTGIDRSRRRVLLAD